LLMEKSFEFGLNKIADAFQKRAETIWDCESLFRLSYL
jgi:hypothetical protein